MNPNGFLATALFIFIAFATPATGSQGPLLAVGGGKRPIPALSAWLRALPAEQSLPIAIVPWASGSPQEAAEGARSDLIQAGAAPQRLIVLNSDAPNARDCNRFSGIFFTGGDQTRLMDEILRTPAFRRCLLQRFRVGALGVAGTSAGTAILSDRRFHGDEPLDRISAAPAPLPEGLGLFPSGVLVDQHFIRRSRWNRLFSALSSGQTGLGVDEDTALFFGRDFLRGTVFGEGQVALIRKEQSRFQVDLYSAGESVALPQEPGLN